MRHSGVEVLAPTETDSTSLSPRSTARKRILFICGSTNQTTQLHQIAHHLPEYDQFLTPYYCNPFLRFFQRREMMEFTILGLTRQKAVIDYFKEHGLALDYEARNGPYDLVVTCSDVIIQKNIRRSKIILVQEGMADPEDWKYHIVKKLRLARGFASTSMTGLSNAYTYFCVASEGFRDFFARRGADPEKILVTGIPNFDNFAEFARRSTFPCEHYILVTTSDSRETTRYENRKRLIRRALEIADGRLVIFKLHPYENHGRATREIRLWAPDALIFIDGNTAAMIANCDVLIATYSSTVLAGVALGKEVYSRYDIDELRRLVPLQHGRAAQNIAEVCRCVLEESPVHA